jgi:hypothetical protein
VRPYPCAPPPRFKQPSHVTYDFTGELQLELKRNISRSLFSMTVTCDCDMLSRYVPGEFKKFNNNWDWAEDKRNTPQAFSHWTLKCSKGRALVCDIQGVGDVWTDPQIHTSYNTNDFGLGNCFQEGIDKFMQVFACLCCTSASVLGAPETFFEVIFSSVMFFDSCFLSESSLQSHLPAPGPHAHIQSRQGILLCASFSISHALNLRSGCQ